MDVRELDVEITELAQNDTPKKYLGGKIEVVGQGLLGGEVYFDVHYHFTVPYDFYNENNELTHTEDLTISEGLVKINGYITSDGQVKNGGIPFSVYDVYEIGNIRYVLDGRFLVTDQLPDEKEHNAKIDIDANYNLTCVVESCKKEIRIEHDLSQTETSFEDYIQNGQMIRLNEHLFDAKVIIDGVLHYGNETTFDIGVAGGIFKLDDLEIQLKPRENNKNISIRTDFYGNVDNKPTFSVHLEGSSHYNAISISFTFEIEGFKSIKCIEKNVSVNFTRGMGKVESLYTWTDFIADEQLFGGFVIEGEIKPMEKSHIKIKLLDSSFDELNKFPLIGGIKLNESLDDYKDFIEVDEVLTRVGELDGEKTLTVQLKYVTQVGDDTDEFILGGNLTIGKDFTVKNDSLSFSSKNGSRLIQTSLNVDDVLNNTSDKLKRLKDITFNENDDVYIGKEVLRLDGNVTVRCLKKNGENRSMEIILGDLNSDKRTNLMTVDYGFVNKSDTGEWLFVDNSKISKIYLGGEKKFLLDVQFDELGNLVGNCGFEGTFDNSGAFEGERMLKLELSFYICLVDNEFIVDNSSKDDSGVTISKLLFIQDYDFFVVEYRKDLNQETYYTVENSNLLENGSDLFNKNVLLYPYDEIIRQRSSNRQWIGLLSSLVNGKDMFKDSKLEVFTCIDKTEDKSLTKTILTKLMDGEGMFSGCLLDTDSVKVILESLASQGDEQFTPTEKLITIGVEDVHKSETINYLESGELPITQYAEENVFYLEINGVNQWKITMEWNERS